MKTIKTNKNEILTLYKCSSPVDITKEYVFSRKHLGQRATVRRALYKVDSTSPVYDGSLWCKIDRVWNEVSATDYGYLLRVTGRVALEVINR